jgi:hypothetical protein
MQEHDNWLDFALNDLKAAKRLLLGDEPLIHPALVLAQQCSEKALKAYLFYKNQPPLRTHNLELLVRKCAIFDTGANVNAPDEDCRTPLHTAKNAEIAHMLIQARAHINEKDCFFEQTPLHLAVDHSRADVVKELLKADADTTIQDVHGKTPVEYAKSTEIIELFKGTPGAKSETFLSTLTKLLGRVRIAK